MKLVYIIGGMCSGKSSVLRTFEKLGACTIDFDIWAKEILNSNCSFEIFKSTEFEQFFNKSGLSDKVGFSDYIFQDKETLLRYNEIFFPIVKSKLDAYLNGLDTDFVVIEYSAWNGTPRQCDIFLSDADFVVGVVCDEKTKFERAENKFGFAYGYSIRAALQPSSEIMRLQCDYVIDNSGDKEVLERECKKLWTKCCEWLCAIR